MTSWVPGIWPPRASSSIKIFKIIFYDCIGLKMTIDISILLVCCNLKVHFLLLSLWAQVLCHMDKLALALTP